MKIKIFFSILACILLLNLFYSNKVEQDKDLTKTSYVTDKETQQISYPKEDELKIEYINSRPVATCRGCHFECKHCVPEDTP